MSNEINHYCIICGKGYHACNNCNEIKTYTPWRSLTDTIEHFQLYMVLQDYINKRITKAEAKKELSNFNLSEKDTFKDSAKNAINEILATKVVKGKEKTEDEVKTDKVIEKKADETLSIENKNNCE